MTSFLLTLPPRTQVQSYTCCCFVVDFSLWFLIIWSQFRLYVFQQFFLGVELLAREHLMCLGVRKLLRM